MAEQPATHDGPQVVILDDAAALTREAARRLVESLGRGIEARGQAHVALTGGSSATALYRELAGEWADKVDWQHVHLWWGDERFVPVDHPDSNIGMTYATLLQAAARGGMSGAGGQGVDVEAGDLPGVGVYIENIHPLEIDEALSETDAAQLVAERYAEKIDRLLPRDADGLPAFDVILLGVGDDGHIMSVFPGSPALRPEAPLVLAVPAPEHIGPHLPRVTLNPSLLRAATDVIVMVPGADKAEIVARVMAQPGRDIARLPARLALRPNAVWLLDRESAAGLDGN